jgi:transcription elongation factor GreA
MCVVGTTEADPAANRMFQRITVGAAILGKKVGAEIHVPTPVGSLLYKIVAIK